MEDETQNSENITLCNENSIKFLSLEKKGRKFKKIRKLKPINFIRRAGGLKSHNLK